MAVLRPPARRYVGPDDDVVVSPPEREGWHPPQVLVCAGLFLVSSDRLLTLNFGSLTLKPSYVLFSVALWFVLVPHVLRPLERVRSPIPGFAPAMALLLAVHVVAGLFGLSAELTIQQLVTILGGAVVPFLAVGFGLKSRAQLERALSAWVAGTLAAATFGFYQFAAPYFGLPQGLPYTGVAAGLGRISAWSYEPAFYAFHVELVLAIVVNDVLAKRRRLGIMPELVALYLIASLVLTNARAAYISFPLIVFLVVRTAGRRGRIDRRAVRVVRLGLACTAVVLALGVPLGVSLPKYIVNRVQSVTNTQEAASNAVRLDLYEADVELVRSRPWLGYGPGNSGLLLADRFPLYRGVDPHAIVANNLVLQTALDAGLVSVPILLAVVVLMYRASRRNTSLEARVLLSGVSAVLFVNAMLTSLFWDMRLWVAIGLAYAAARVELRDLRQGSATRPEARPARSGSPTSS